MEDFRQRAEAAPLISGSQGQRNYYAPLCRQLAEQAEIPLPREVRAAGPARDLETIASMSEPELISNDNQKFDDDLFYWRER